MIDRNHRLVESAELLLAVYNGTRRSGTGATVNYARKLGREIIMIDPVTLNITHEDPANTQRNQNPRIYGGTYDPHKKYLP